jgi:glucosamine--fructose-6-phosphate aminotransferase (isomerizing)
MKIGQHTYNEIMSQPEAWERTLEHLHTLQSNLARVDSSNFEDILFTGCGSTYYLSVAAATLAREAGIEARALPASELWLYPKSSYANKKTLLVAVSRSGETTETIKAVQAFKENNRGTVLTLVCYPQSALAKLGDVNVILEAGQEQSIAQTRAFSTLYLATVFLVMLWSKRHAELNELSKLPEACKHLLNNYHTLAERYGKNLSLERFYFLGSGARYGLASELSLKMKEMTLSHSEPFHFMEFRHGPKSMANENTLMIGLVSEVNNVSEQAVLADIKKQGAHILSLGESKTDISLSSTVPELIRNALYLPVVQLMAYERSIAKGLNPDKPNNLDAVVVLETV